MSEKLADIDKFKQLVRSLFEDELFKRCRIAVHPGDTADRTRATVMRTNFRHDPPSITVPLEEMVGVEWHAPDLFIALGSPDLISRNDIVVFRQQKGDEPLYVGYLRETDSPKPVVI